MSSPVRGKSLVEQLGSKFKVQGSKLEILGFDLEICLRMVANRTHFGSFLANHDMTAVAALPDHLLVAGENESAFDIGQQLSVTLLMMLLDFTHHGEKRRNVAKTLFLGGLANPAYISVHS